MDDERPEVRERMTALLRAAGPARRLALARSLTRTTRALSRQGLRRRHPEWSQAQLDDAFVTLLYGPELAGRLREWRQRTGR